MSKTKRPIIRIHDLETNEIIDREMNDAEFAQHEANQITEAAREVEVQEKIAQRQAILDRLGLTADEAQLLFG